MGYPGKEKNSQIHEVNLRGAHMRSQNGRKGVTGSSSGSTSQQKPDRHPLSRITLVRPQARRRRKLAEPGQLHPLPLPVLHRRVLAGPGQLRRPARRA